MTLLGKEEIPGFAQGTKRIALGTPPSLRILTRQIVRVNNAHRNDAPKSASAFGHRQIDSDDAG